LIPFCRNWEIKQWICWGMVCVCAVWFVPLGNGQTDSSQLIETTLLIEALRSPDKNVRSSAIDELVKIGAPAVAPLINTLIFDSDSHVRWWANQALVKIGAPAVAPLIVALRDRQVRDEASEILFSIGAPAIAPLIAALKDGDFEARQEVAVVLGSIGAPAVAPLAAALRDPDTRVREGAAAALEKMATEARFSSVNPVLHEAAMQALRKFGTESLIAALRDPDRNVSYSAATTLSRVATDDVLTADLKNVDPKVRSFAARALGEHHVIGLRYGPWTDVLVAALKDPDPEVRAAAATSLGALTEGAYSCCLEGEERDYFSRHVVPALREALRERDTAVIVGASRFFCKNLEPGWVDVLIEALNTSGTGSLETFKLDMALYLHATTDPKLQQAATDWAGRHGLVFKTVFR